MAKHYYVCKDGHILSDYTDYEQAKLHTELLDGELMIQDEPEIAQ